MKIIIKKRTSADALLQVLRRRHLRARGGASRRKKLPRGVPLEPQETRGARGDGERPRRGGGRKAAGAAAVAGRPATSPAELGGNREEPVAGEPEQRLRRRCERWAPGWGRRRPPAGPPGAPSNAAAPLNATADAAAAGGGGGGRGAGGGGAQQPAARPAGRISFGAGPPPVFSAATAGLLTAAGKK